MSKLKELEKRLRDEPGNLGLRVMVAGALHEAGRRDDAVELYRSVAIAYREQGRLQQALTVCRSILEIAPHDLSCQALLGMLVASQPAALEAPPGARIPAPPSGAPWSSSPSSPSSSSSSSSPPLAPLFEPDPEPDGGEESTREWTSDLTPLPIPLPYHVADPTMATPRKFSIADLPQSLQEELERYPEIAGIANAARQISDTLLATRAWDDDDDPAEEGEEREGDEEGDDEEGDDEEGEEVEASNDEEEDAGESIDLDPRASQITIAELDTVIGPPSLVPGRTSSADLAGLDSDDSDDSDDDDPTLLVADEPSQVRALDEGRPTLPVLRAGSHAQAREEERPTMPLPVDASRARRVDEERPTIPLVSGVPRAQIIDEQPRPRAVPARVRVAPAAPAALATGPLASAFFAPLPPQHRAAVLQRFRRQMVATGMAVIRRGETGHGLVIVLRGRLELHADRADGARVSLETVLPGEYVGEVGLLARAPGVAHVVAVVDSEILVLAASDFYEVTGAFPALSAELKSVADRRMRAHAQRLKV